MADFTKPKASPISEAILARKINAAQDQLDDLTLTVGGMQQGGGSMGLGAPEPRVPFKVFSRPSPDGIFITVDAGIPMDTDELRIITIDKKHNTLKAGESTEDAIARAVQQKKSYRIPVSEAEAMVGRITAELKDPFEPRKIGKGDANPDHDSDDARAVQLIRLIAINQSGKKKIPIGSNPDMDPFSQGTFPFTALVVRDTYDDGVPIADMDDSDKRYFTIGANFGAVVNGPALNKIICNHLIMTTSITMAELSFQINADDTNPDTTFDDQNIKQIFLNFRPVVDPAAAMMPADSDADPIKLSLEIQDPNAKTVFIKGLFPFGEEYEWRSVVYVVGDDKIPITATGIRFFAGGDGDLTKLVQIPGLTPGTNIPGQSDDAKLQLQVDQTESDVTHAYFTVRYKQPGTSNTDCTPENRAVIFKRVKLLEKRPNDAQFNRIEGDQALDNPEYFAVGQEIFIRFKVPQRKRDTVLYQAQILGLNSTTLTTYQSTISNLPGSTNNGTPPDPSTSAAGAGNTSDLVDNIRDGDSGRAKARLGFRVWSSLMAQAGTPGAPTFRQIKVDMAGIRLRRQRNDDANDPVNLDEATTRNHWHYVHIPPEALDSTSVIITIHNNHLGDKFIWDKCALGQSEIYAESPGVASITFYAGFGMTSGAYDPTRLVNRTISAILINKRHSKIICGFDQGTIPSPLNPPVFIRRIDLWVKYPDQAQIDRLKGRSLKMIPEYSTNDTSLTYTLPNTAIHKEVEFRIPHKDRIQANAIQVQFEIKSEGNRSVFVPSTPMLIPYSTGNDEPAPPSTPMAADIILNTLVGESKAIKARLRFRVFASDAARSNASITFASVLIDSIKVVFGELGSTTALTHKEFALSANELNSNFIDIQVDDFAVARAYSWIKTVGSNAGGHTAANSGNITITGTGFIAGGRIGTTNLPELGMVSVVRTEIDEKTSKVAVTFTQPNPPILLKVVRLQEQILTSPNGYSEPSYHKEDAVDFMDFGLTYQQFTGSPVTVELTQKHPRRATFNLRVVLVGIGDGNNMPTLTITQSNLSSQDMTLSPPTQAPSSPAYAQIIQNVLNFGAKNLKAKVTLRVFANTIQNATFASVGADSVYVFLARTADSLNEKRLKFGGPIKDTSRTFIDIECDGLDVGQLYDWIDSVTARNGLQASTSVTPGTVQLYAGNVAIVNLGTSFSTGFSGADFVVSSLVQKNPRFSKLIVSLRQPGSLAGVPFQPNTSNKLPILIAGILFEEQEGGIGSFDAVSSKELLLQPSFQTAGTSFSSKNFHHKKNQTMVYRATLMGMDGSSIAVNTSEFIPNRGDFDDDGLPAGFTGTIMARWNQRGLRITYPLPPNNMNTHTRCVIMLTLQGNGNASIFAWAPSGSPGNPMPFTQDVSGTFIGATAPQVFPAFINEVGKQGHVNFNTPANVQNSIDQFNSTLFNRLVNQGGSLTVYYYVYNKFLLDGAGNPAPNSYTFIVQANILIGAGFVVDGF